MEKCRECGQPADPAYTMFQPPLYWCSRCGEFAHLLTRAIERAAEEHGRPFLRKLALEIERAEAGGNQ